MKKLLILLFFPLISLSQNVFNNSLDDGLISYYPFSGNANDIVNGYNGVLINEMKELPKIVAQTEVGKTVNVKVWRNKKEILKKIKKPTYLIHIFVWFMINFIKFAMNKKTL